MSSIRKDLKLGSLMFVAGDLAEFYGTSPEHNSPTRLSSIALVRVALSELPYRVPCTGFVSSAGLRSADEHYVHFSQQSYSQLGVRYAQAVLGLQNLQGTACQ